MPYALCYGGSEIHFATKIHSFIQVFHKEDKVVNWMSDKASHPKLPLKQHGAVYVWRLELIQTTFMQSRKWNYNIVKAIMFKLFLENLINSSKPNPNEIIQNFWPKLFRNVSLTMMTVSSTELRLQGIFPIWPMKELTHSILSSSLNHSCVYLGVW